MYRSITGERYTFSLQTLNCVTEAESFPKDLQEESLSENEAKEFYKKLESIEFKNVDFAYPDDSLHALKNVSITFKKGGYVALTGASGSGKSTVLKLLLSLYPIQNGEKLIKTKEKAEALSAKHRILFAYVPQGNVLMSGTVKEVLTFRNTSVSEDNIRYALKVTCAEDFVNQLEHGLDTKLSDRGSGLSEGQMQRLAIARAILSNRPILLLDEATSAIDEATEAAVLKNLHAMTDKTVVIVTHGPAALAICNREVSFE